MAIQRTSGPTATAIGSMPGENFDETLRQVLDQASDLPFLPELPARGIIAGMTGRSLAVVAELGFDLQPAGWRLTDAPGIDHRRARSLLAQDLDSLEDLAQGYVGDLKVQLAGPWTLAATVERPRGDRLLADRGARTEVAQAFAEGIGTHLRDLQRRVPGAKFVLQIDEPALPAVLGGGIPTSSGFSRHRAVHPPEASEVLGWVFEAVTAGGASPIVHCCAADLPIELFRQAGAQGISLDLDLISTENFDALGAAFEAGTRILLGVVPSTDPAQVPSVADVVRRVERTLDMLGFGLDEVGAQLVLTPTCGLAGASASYARTALSLVGESAARLSGD